MRCEPAGADNEKHLRVFPREETRAQGGIGSRLAKGQGRAVGRENGRARLAVENRNKALHGGLRWLQRKIRREDAHELDRNHLLRGPSHQRHELVVTTGWLVHDRGIAFGRSTFVRNPESLDEPWIIEQTVNHVGIDELHGTLSNFTKLVGGVKRVSSIDEGLVRDDRASAEGVANEGSMITPLHASEQHPRQEHYRLGQEGDQEENDDQSHE